MNINNQSAEEGECAETRIQEKSDIWNAVAS